MPLLKPNTSDVRGILMTTEDTTPLISRTAFACPHCGAYATQYWYKLVAERYSEDSRTPTLPTEDMIESVEKSQELPAETRRSLTAWARRMLIGKPFMMPNNQSLYSQKDLNNCNISQCYNCDEIAIWVADQIVFPRKKIAIAPNPDMPALVRQLFDEAREIVGASPKGAAALLRLSIQHLCRELGESGKNIDADIASLVAKGLNPLVQKSLDIVRVIGNESVHPGEIDLNDNRDVAVKLFGLVNIVCEQMISHPQDVDALYSSLPARKLEGIENRDKKRQE